MEDNQQGSGTSQVVVVDKKSMSYIKDRARELFQQDPGGDGYLDRVLYKALHDYICIQGGTPGFEVKL